MLVFGWQVALPGQEEVKNLDKFQIIDPNIVHNNTINF